MITDNLFNEIVLLWTGCGIITFFLLLFVSAPYGRLSRKGWGPKIDSTLAWILMETVSFGIMGYLFLITIDSFSIAHFIALLWLGHYGYRAFVFPLVRKKGASTMPIVIMCMAMVFNIMNAGVNGFHLFLTDANYSSLWFFDLRFIIGLLLFLAGFIVNISSDSYLRSLRRGSEKDYKIPQKGFFRFISCPNYFGEIMEWCGWALLTFSLAGLSFAVWTIANLLPRALSYHKWYKQTFTDYPENRKAIIPFLL
ncbi:MAG: DUF1295 domain-containing protein [Spirochaetales bacterium]|nr:DUF1295 domain-containing protein [Spirochaetales bacterium]